jgi:hypothetical protein
VWEGVPDSGARLELSSLKRQARTGIGSGHQPAHGCKQRRRGTESSSYLGNVFYLLLAPFPSEERGAPNFLIPSLLAIKYLSNSIPSVWWVHQDSNLGPPPYQGGALTS